MVYSADPRRDIVVRACDEDFSLLFHRPSAQTHVVEPYLVPILEALQDGPLDAEGVTEALARTLDIETESGESATDVIAARLDELHRLGLVDLAA